MITIDSKEIKRRTLEKEKVLLGLEEKIEGICEELNKEAQWLETELLSRGLSSYTNTNIREQNFSEHSKSKYTHTELEFIAPDHLDISDDEQESIRTEVDRLYLEYTQRVCELRDDTKSLYDNTYTDLIRLTILEPLLPIDKDGDRMAQILTDFPDEDNYIRVLALFSRGKHDTLKETGIKKGEISDELMNSFIHRHTKLQINTYIIRNHSTRVQGRDMIRYVMETLCTRYHDEDILCMPIERRDLSKPDPLDVLTVFGWASPDTEPTDARMEEFIQRLSHKKPYGNS